MSEWNGDAPRLHQARGGITLIDEDTPRSAGAGADTASSKTDTAQQQPVQPGPKSGVSSVVFRLGSKEAQAWGELGSIQAREIG